MIIVIFTLRHQKDCLRNLAFFSHLKFFLMNILHQFPHDHFCIITKHFVDHAVNLLTQWHHILKHISGMKLALSTEWKQATIKGDVSWLHSSFCQYCQYYTSLRAMECWWRNYLYMKKKSQLLVKQIYIPAIISNVTNNKMNFEKLILQHIKNAREGFHPCPLVPWWGYKFVSTSELIKKLQVK